MNSDAQGTALALAGFMAGSLGAWVVLIVASGLLKADPDQRTWYRWLASRFFPDGYPPRSLSRVGGMIFCLVFFNLYAVVAPICFAAGFGKVPLVDAAMAVAYLVLQALLVVPMFRSALTARRRSSRRQLDVCRRFGVVPTPAPALMKVGISENVRQGLIPINGLRHKPEGDTTGWCIWAGEELSSAPDFFKPLHVEHLIEWCPDVIPYLQLPPGWRFLLAPGVEDVWEDPSLL